MTPKGELIGSLGMSNVLSEEKTASYRTGEARMAVTAHRASHWCASRNSQRVPESGGHRCTAATLLGKANPGKTGQRSDPPTVKQKPAKGRDPGLYCAFFSKTGHPKYMEAYRELIEQPGSRP